MSVKDELRNKINKELHLTENSDDYVNVENLIKELTHELLTKYTNAQLECYITLCWNVDYNDDDLFGRYYTKSDFSYDIFIIDDRF